MKRVAKLLVPLALAVCILNPRIVIAHPGSGIVGDSQGNVPLSVINRGLLKFTPDGKVTLVLEQTCYWITADAPGSEWTNAHGGQHDYRPRVRKAGADGEVTTLATFPE